MDKNGGAVAAPGELAGGGVLQAAADGNSVTYGSAASFGPGAQGAPEGSQYLSSRGAAGWTTANLTVPLFSGSYGTAPAGVPYQLFSADLGRGLLLNGRSCRSQDGVCPVANPPLPGTDAPAGYQNYYLREAGAGFEALLGAGDVAATAVGPAELGVGFAGAAPDLSHVVLSSCAALTPSAAEVALGDGCDPSAPNLYAWSPGAGLSLVNAAPGATLAAPSGAVSSSSAVYFSEGGNPHLRQGPASRQVDPAHLAGATFETASANGSVAFFTKGAHLWRYLAGSDTATDLTPAGGVAGVLGASADGSHVYYLAADGVYLSRGATTTKVAAAADASNYPPAVGTARVSADGTRLLFLSSASLTGYDNRDQKTGLPDTQVFLYDASGAGLLHCVSCRPNGTRPVGSSTIPGVIANGEQASATRAYKPRALSADGTHVFFDSADAVVPSGDSNNEPDVYQWQAQGPNCAKPAGCVALISSGRSPGGASFVDASVSGDDVFFLTDGSLVGTDPGSVDLYDARVGGGFPEPLVPIPCFGDFCQNLPSEPVDPGLTTQLVGPGNPPVRYVKHGGSARRKCKRTRAGKAARKCRKTGKRSNHKKTKPKQAAKRGGRR